MTLIVFLLAYVIRRRLDSQGHLYGENLWRLWFHRAAKVRAGRESALSAGLAMVLLPALIFGALRWVADSYGWHLALYPVECLILVLLMGTPGWEPVLKAYSGAWGRGDMQGAWHHVQAQLPAEERGAALSPDTMHLAVARALMLAVFQRFFLVAFWYGVGGIGFAILARGLVALAQQWPRAAARPGFSRLAEVMAWIPARLLAVTFGIAGDLAGWLREIRGRFLALGKTSAEVLMISANGSLTGYALDPSGFSRMHPELWADFGGRSLRAVRDLLNRSMLVWICALALLVIFGVA